MAEKATAFKRAKEISSIMTKPCYAFFTLAVPLALNIIGASKGIAWEEAEFDLTRFIKRSLSAPGFTKQSHLCYESAYTANTGKRGINIRSAPNSKAPIIGRIPSARPALGTFIAPELDVIGSHNGWLLIENVKWIGYGDEFNDEVIFKGMGWISADLVEFSIEANKLLSEPRHFAKSILPLANLDADPAWSGDRVKILRVHGCSGSFFDVSIETPEGKRVRGWVGGTCTNQVTTCGGATPLYEERGRSLLESHEVQDKNPTSPLDDLPLFKPDDTQSSRA